MKKTWHISFGVSLAVHAMILIGIPSFFTHSPEKRAHPQREITIQPERIEKIALEPEQELMEVMQPKPLPYVEKILDKLLDAKEISNLQKSHFLSTSAQEIVLSEPSPEQLKNNPAYMDYYRLIREKIRTSTYQNYDINQQGEILASFLVLQDGTLQNIQFNPGAQDSKPLHMIAKKSIESAAPFPTFPQELKEYRYLRFNVSIYFKNN